MFYIEKNDKPNWLIKKANIIKVEDNTIILPIYEKIKPKGIEKLAKKNKQNNKKKLKQYKSSCKQRNTKRKNNI